MNMNTATCRAGGGSRQGRAPSERWLLPVPLNAPLIVLDTGVVVRALRDAPSAKNRAISTVSVVRKAARSVRTRLFGQFRSRGSWRFSLGMRNVVA